MTWLYDKGVGMIEKDKEAFKAYLLAIGFNDHGAAECISRFDKHRQDEIDLILYNRYRQEKNTIGTG